MKRILFFYTILFCAFGANGQSMYRVEHVEKAAQSSLIVEGEVVDKTSFWNASHTSIFTANKVKVYKVFKGETESSFIEILTRGGTVGTETITVSDLLEVEKGDVGTFFCFPNKRNLISPVTGNPLYDVYASAQGFFKYYVEGNKAADPFNKFSSITGVVYPLLVKLTGKEPIIKDPTFTIKETGFLPRTSGSVSSITPTTVNAGATSDPASNVITITGTGFGAASGSAAIRFNDDNAGGTYYTVAYNSPEVISWSDTEIKVRVPSRAGTGSIIVRDAAGNEASSFDILNVRFSIITATSNNVIKQSNLINANGNGGYNLLYSTNLSPESAVTFNRALKTWKDLSGFNVSDGGTTGTAKVAADGECVVFSDNATNGDPLTAGVLAVCYSYTSACAPASDYAFRKTEFDIIIRSSYSTGSNSFSYGPCEPSSTTIDLETVLLHELGHALNLAHIIDNMQGSGSSANPAKLMNATVSNGVKRTSPDASAYEGSIYTCSTNSSINFGPCDARSGHVQSAIILDAKDKCPFVFPTTTTAPGQQVVFDLEHATSNKDEDPDYTGVLCNNTGTAVTNNLYYVLRTTSLGALNINVSDFALYPAEAAATCTGASTPTVRLSFYQVNSCPTGQNFPAPSFCTSFTGNGNLATIAGLPANTNYLVYVDGKSNTKASFKLTFNGTALPLKLEKFVGEARDNYNELKWTIAAYSDVHKISLERSEDGTKYTSISTFENNFEINKEYNHRDVNPFTGQNYYRLAIYNKDGSIQYSNVVLLKRTDRLSINVYPNPIVDNINVSVTAGENVGRIQLKLYNDLGQLVFARTNIIGAGSTKIDLRANGLSAGSYKLIVTDKDNQVIKTMNLQKF